MAQHNLRQANLYGAERLRHWLLSQNWFSSWLLPALPRSVRWSLRTAYFAPMDLIDRFKGKTTKLAPPRSLNFTGAVSDLEESAATFVTNLEARAGLRPSSVLLDVGSGMGRLAMGLISYLSADGSYDGLEIVPSAVKWCQDNLSPGHPNIRFHHADVFNKEYNPAARTLARDYRFPFGDNTFDVITLISVFTHMLPEDMDNYLKEIARVLKPGGRSYVSYSLLNAESFPRMTGANSILNFKHRYGACWTVSKTVPELAVGYEEDYVEASYARHKLDYRLLSGNWCGQPSGQLRGDVAEQDVVIGIKASAEA